MPWQEIRCAPGRVDGETAESSSCNRIKVAAYLAAIGRHVRVRYWLKEGAGLVLTQFWERPYFDSDSCHSPRFWLLDLFDWLFWLFGRNCHQRNGPSKLANDRFELLIYLRGSINSNCPANLILCWIFSEFISSNHAFHKFINAKLKFLVFEIFAQVKSDIIFRWKF